MENKRFSLSGNFEDVQEYDSQFLKVKMKVFAFGENRNGSDITEEAFESAKHTIFNIPIVAKFTEDIDKYGEDGDLEGHNPYLSTDKNGNMVIKNDTYPIGVISSDANISFENVNEGTDENPEYKKYVVVDNVYLWKRYDATQKIKEWLENGIDPKVSMEIGNVKGGYIKNSGSYKITSFIFEAVAALGSNVTPCFPMAQIEKYSKSTFEESFYEMLKELKFSMAKNMQHLESNVAEDFNKGGSKVPDEIVELLKKYSLTEQQIFEKEISYEGISLEEFEGKIKTAFSIETDEKQFSLTSEQMYGELRRCLSCVETITEVYWGEVYTHPRYYYVDCKPEDRVVVAMDEKNWYLVGFNYTVVGDKVEIDTSSCKRFKLDYMPMELDGMEDQNVQDPLTSNMMSLAKSEFMVSAKEKEMTKKFEEEKSSIQEELTSLKSNFAEMESKANRFEAQLNEKLMMERQEAENEVYDKFSLELTEDEMKPIKDIASNLSIEDITEKLFALAGKKKVNFNFSKSTKPLGFQIPVDGQKASGKSYDDLFEKYKTKDE